MVRKVKTTVTHLEMLEDPHLRCPLPVGKTAIMRAERPPAHFYRYLYDTIGRDYFWVNRRALSDTDLLKIIHDEQIYIYVLYMNGAPAGFAELDLRSMPTADLSFLGIMPEFIGKGLGRFLLCETIGLAWMHHPKKLIVQTCTLDHRTALPLYQRNGFTPCGQEEIELVEP
ncbi:MAG: GNAT family N-acetyltransferase [Rhodobiaceae bacterium]|nr:GNAT family N-acetyltransferase [Rhodobiaceae bacterium]